jgi:hypothetical protein
LSYEQKNPYGNRNKLKDKKAGQVELRLDLLIGDERKLNESP